MMGPTGGEQSIWNVTRGGGAGPGSGQVEIVVTSSENAVSGKSNKITKPAGGGADGYAAFPFTCTPAHFSSRISVAA